MRLSEGQYNEKLLNFPEQACADYIAGWLDVQGVRVHEFAPLHLFLGMVERYDTFLDVFIVRQEDMDAWHVRLKEA
eukprot:95443-Chlamydomonas_euryale.AAC.1